MLAVQSRIVKFFVTDTAADARNLFQRLQEVASLRSYIRRNRWLVALESLVIVLTSFASLLGIFTLLPELHWLFVFPLIVLLPVFLGGSLFVQAFVFFSWLEGRSLARVLGRRGKQAPGPLARWLVRKLRLDMSPFPPVPWFLTTVFLFIPLGLLLHVLPVAGYVVVGFAIATPIIYGLFDR